MDWYKRYIGDYQRDTAEESLTQRGAYDSLLDEYYRREGPLPADKKLLFRITRSVERWEIEAVDYVLAKFFTLTARGYEHKRCEDVIAQYKKAAEKYLANLAGANVSKAHMQSAPQSAVQSATENPDTRNQIKEKPKSYGAQNAPKRATPFPEGFFLSQHLVEIAQSWGITNPADEWTHFESHHIAKGSRFVNWDRAWVTWCIRSRKMNPRISDEAVRREAMAGSHR